MNEDRSYSLAKNLIWAGAISVSVIAGVTSNYQIKKSNYETQPQRIEAVESLMNSEGFRDYTTKRKELSEK